MQKIMPILLIVLILVLAGCLASDDQTTEAASDTASDTSSETLADAEACAASLAAIVEDQVIMDITGAEVTDVDETPIGSGSDAQAIILNDDDFYVVRYETVEDASGVVAAIASAGVLDDGEIQEEVTVATFGDEQLQIVFEDAQKVGTLIRYGDRLTFARAFNEGTIDGINESFDGALSEYVETNPACAYLSPETR